MPSSQAASLAPTNMAVDDVLAGGGAEQYREGPTHASKCVSVC